MVYIGSLTYDYQIKESKGIIIFGGGTMLTHLLKKLEQMDVAEKIIAICDSDISMQGREIAGMPVLSPMQAYERYRNFDFIVYNQYFMEICKQLKINDIPRIHLIRQGSL